MPFDSRVEDLVTRIHATPHKSVLAYAGAGSQALAWLHGVGGSSRTILSAIDIYGSQSMRHLLGFMPAKFTSRRVARLMAAAAHDLARKYTLAAIDPATDPGSSEPEVTGAAATDPFFGLGSTATIATDRTKRGDHRVATAVRDSFGTVRYALTLDKGARDRAGEEELVSLVMLRAVADACGVFGAPELPLEPTEVLTQTYRPSELLAAIENGRREMVVVRPNGQIVTGDEMGSRAVLSGSFNPVHDGHLELAAVAAARVGLPALFELPLINAAKDPIALVEARKRALQFGGIGSVALTRSPLFEQKAELLPGSVFVVGVDTAERVLDKRFYDGDQERMLASLERIRAHRCRFLVAGRERDGSFRTLAQVPIPGGFRDLFESLDEEEFRNDVSSTKIRRTWQRPEVAR